VIIKAIIINCKTLHHTATHCNTLQHTATRCCLIDSAETQWLDRDDLAFPKALETTTDYTTLQHTTIHCNIPQHTATHCNTLQHTAMQATRCKLLQDTAIHCNTMLQICGSLAQMRHNDSTEMTRSFLKTSETITHCDKLQHTATHCNTLQHTATHCNTLQRTVVTMQHVGVVSTQRRHNDSVEMTWSFSKVSNTLQHTATWYITLQQTDILISLRVSSKTDSSTLQRTAVHWNMLQHVATFLSSVESFPKVTAAHCNVLQHTATCYNTLQQSDIPSSSESFPKVTAIHCKTQHYAATHYNTLQQTEILFSSESFPVNPTRRTSGRGTLQHTASHCNTPHHTATRCNTLQHTATHCNTLRYTATHYNTLQQTDIVFTESVSVNPTAHTYGRGAHNTHIKESPHAHDWAMSHSLVSVSVRCVFAKTKMSGVFSWK